jgi:hypothetical protein
MILQFIILATIPTNNLSFPSVCTTQGSVPPSLLCSPSGCTTSLQGSNAQPTRKYQRCGSRNPSCNNFHNLSFPQQFQPTGSHSPQPAQPKEVYPLLCTTVPQVVPLPSRAPTQGQTGSLRVVAPGTPVVIMESPNLQIVANVLPALHL